MHQQSVYVKADDCVGWFIIRHTSRTAREVGRSLPAVPSTDTVKGEHGLNPQRRLRRLYVLGQVGGRQGCRVATAALLDSPLEPLEAMLRGIFKEPQTSEPTTRSIEIFFVPGGWKERAQGGGRTRGTAGLDDKKLPNLDPSPPRKCARSAWKRCAAVSRPLSQHRLQASAKSV